MINLPEQAPFDPAEREALSRILGDLSEAQRHWLSGFLAGVSKGNEPGQGPAEAGGSLLVLYGTESGNSEELAARTAKSAKAAGFRGRVVNMADSRPADLSGAESLLVVVLSLIHI